MKTTTKLAAGLILASVVASSAFAYGNMNGNAQGYAQGNGYNCSMKKGQHNGKMMKHHKKGKSSMMSIFRQLDLSVEQKQKMYEIRKEARKNRQTIDQSFTSTSFDKDKYVSIMKQKRDNMLESKAEMLDKMYQVLTPKQKEQFKVLLDLRISKQQQNCVKRGMNFDKNSNGRG